MLGGLLLGPRAREAFLLRSVLQAPWSIRVKDEAPLTVLAVVRGSAWLLPDAEPVQLRAGDVAVLRGPDHYTVADAVDTPPQAVIHRDQTCTRVDGGQLGWQDGSGIRTWGNTGIATSVPADGTGHEDGDHEDGDHEDGDHEDEATVLLTGAYRAPGEVGARLAAALPPVLTIGYGAADRAVVDLLLTEMSHDRPGQEAVLDRLLDVLLVTALRTWFDRPEAATPAWYRAQSDREIGTVLRLVQHHPERHWTVAGLAAAAGMSRAAMARRFTELVGVPPMAFLTSWRLALAADLLVETELTLERIADRVGYGTPFALSAAFRRSYGASPRQYRAAQPTARPA